MLAQNWTGRRKWQPRYVAYAKAHGRTPDKMLKHDQKRFPGGCMCGFILWISKMRQKFYELHRECFLTTSTILSTRPSRWSRMVDLRALQTGPSDSIIMDQDAWTRFLQKEARS